MILFSGFFIQIADAETVIFSYRCPHCVERVERYGKRCCA